MRRRLPTYLAALAGCTLCATPGAAQERAPLRVRDILHQRPDADKGPTPVTVGLYVIDIAKIDSVEQAATVDFVIRLTWNDPRLAGGSDAARSYDLDEIWHPRPLVLNQRRLFKSLPDVISVDPSGNALYTQRLTGTITSRLELRDFPFDRNTFAIEIVTAGYGPGDIQLVLDPSVTGRSATFALVDAEVSEGRAKTGTHFFAPANEDLGLFAYEFEVQRYTDYFVWKVILPLAVIVCMSWLVFWMDPSQIGPQIGLGATAVLTLIAYRFLLGSLVPRVSYLTRLDLFILGSTVLVFLALVETIAIVWLTAAKGVDRDVRWMNRWARALFPLGFVLVLTWAFWM